MWTAEYRSSQLTTDKRGAQGGQDSTQQRQRRADPNSKQPATASRKAAHLDRHVHDEQWVNMGSTAIQCHPRLIEKLLANKVVASFHAYNDALPEFQASLGRYAGHEYSETCEKWMADKTSRLSHAHEELTKTLEELKGVLEKDSLVGQYEFKISKSNFGFRGESLPFHDHDCDSLIMFLQDSVDELGTDDTHVIQREDQERAIAISKCVGSYDGEMLSFPKVRVEVDGCVEHDLEIFDLEIRKLLKVCDVSKNAGRALFIAGGVFHGYPCYKEKNLADYKHTLRLVVELDRLKSKTP